MSLAKILGNRELFKQLESVFLSVCLNGCLSECLSVCLSEWLSLSECLNGCLSLFLSVFVALLNFQFYVLSFINNLILSFFLSGLLFLVSNFSFNWKCLNFSSSQNSRREWELFIVPENRWREEFGNCFGENFGNCREMTEKLWCLVRLG